MDQDEDIFICFSYEPNSDRVNGKAVLKAMEEYLETKYGKETKNMNKREEEIISFICVNYCQFCDNHKCNCYEIMEKYQSNSLTSLQMEEVNEFRLHKVSCRSHMPNEGFLMFGHIIEVHYMHGRVEKKRGWYTSKEISEIWDGNVEYIDILFSDV
ncbi:MAG: hypothetical protein ISS45_12555 [Candidatus Omnitrophica bacterium]|nr:hypothetical protein [Candidatus Omnitrophota bacterium]